MTETRPYAIELKGITKTFGSVVANKDINLQLRHGEILSLLGENGSGKTTLMNMLSGIYKPDSGSIYVEGKQVTINSPEDAKKLGIGMVHQHFKLIESFTVADKDVYKRQATRIPIAIGRSREGPSFLISAGAKLTVMRRIGKSKPEFLIAARTRSRLSLTEASGKPTISKAANPAPTSTSTITG